MKKVNVLGTKYTIYMGTKNDFPLLEKIDGYCDKTTKKIVVSAEPEDNELGNYETYQKKVLRHEIIHAFLIESGLHENFKHEEWGHDETTIDWFAVQFPKLLKAFEEAEAI